LENKDAVLHFAANAYVGESVANPRKYFENNLRSAITLANAAVDAGVKYLVFSSTCAVYGVPRAMPISEDVQPNPVNPYGFTKFAFERLLESYRVAYGLNYVALRYFNAAGADEQGGIGEVHEPETHLIPLALAAAGGDLESLTVFGDDYPTADGTCIRDYIHVNDLADAHVRALEHLSRGKQSCALNLGTGRGFSVRQVIAAVESVTGRHVEVRVAPRRAGDPPELVAAPGRAKEVLGWSASRSLSDIVDSAWHWYQESKR
jgi:UDP-glucose-4-epimerase GalE